MSKNSSNRGNYYSRSTNQGRRRNYKRKNGKAAELKNLAYNMGLVEKGLKNPDSQISAAYSRGLNKTKQEKKPLF